MSWHPYRLLLLGYIWHRHSHWLLLLGSICTIVEAHRSLVNCWIRSRHPCRLLRHPSVWYWVDSKSSLRLVLVLLNACLNALCSESQLIAMDHLWHVLMRLLPEHLSMASYICILVLIASYLRTDLIRYWHLLILWLHHAIHKWVHTR